MDETQASIQPISIRSDDKNKIVDNGARSKDEPPSGGDTEKYDKSPENLEKSSCDITPNDDLSTSVSGSIATPNQKHDATSSNSPADETVCKSGDDKTDARNKSTGFAFTIDFNDGKTVDNRKYKEMAERFQNRQLHQQEQRRHRRGVSLSKLDDSRKSTTSLNNIENNPNVTVDDSNISSVVTKPPFKQRTTPTTKVAELSAKNDDAKCDTKVALRKSRPVATSQTVNGIVKDSSKRHSWSPRSSLNYEKMPQLPPQEHAKGVPIKCTENTGNFQPKSTILQRALESNPLRPSSNVGLKIRSTGNVTRNTLIDHVVTAPLEYVRNSDDEGSIGDASQATYTLDGDNYTEEEKERMSIDKLGKSNFDLSIESRSRHDGLSKNYATGHMKIDAKHSQRNYDNLNVSSKAPAKSTKSYLDKFKNRVKTIGDRTFHKSNGTTAATNDKLLNLQVVRADDSSLTDADHGVFTSITAYGVLKNKQHQQSDNSTSNYTSGGNRKQSLTKFQIDSSEYVQPKVDESLMNSYTDYEKAKHNEYKLNIFSAVSSYTTSSGTSPVQTDEDNASVECVDDKLISIKTAPTKNDWIQEWAKNARRRNNLLTSSATASPKLQHNSKTVYGRAKQIQQQGNDDARMSQSYDTYFNQTEQFGDDVIENSSDECMAHVSRKSFNRTKATTTKTENGVEKSTRYSGLRPPISPTKIPSPMHTQLRARSSSANRSFHHSSNTVRNFTVHIFFTFNNRIYVYRFFFCSHF